MQNGPIKNELEMIIKKTIDKYSQGIFEVFLQNGMQLFTRKF
jgi:hypothetical protein